MDNFKGSELPWKKSFTIVGNKRAVRCEGYLICILNPPMRYSGQDERYEEDLKRYEADHNLIAAAPDLLEALIAITDQFKRVDPLYSSDKKLIDKAESAIQKALGKETKDV